MQTTITSTLVGTLEFDAASGFAGQVAVGGADGDSCWLHIAEEVSTEPRLLATVAPTVDAFHELVDQARSALRGELAEMDSSVVEFVRFHVEELGDLEGDFPAAARAFLSGTGSPAAMADLFRATGLAFHRAPDGELSFWLDFALVPEDSDEVLCVRFDADRGVSSIGWES